MHLLRFLSGFRVLPPAAHPLAALCGSGPVTCAPPEIFLITKDSKMKSKRSALRAEVAERKDSDIAAGANNTALIHASLSLSLFSLPPP